MTKLKITKTETLDSETRTIEHLELILKQNEEHEKCTAALTKVNAELIFQNKEKEKRAEELFLANKELAFQNSEKEKKAKELILVNDELKKSQKHQEEYIQSFIGIMHMTSHKIR